MRIGLRIDVDTYRGTRWGVVNLLEILAVHGIKASFFFSVGPDNMGRHLWRMLRPAFVKKILRSKAVKLYGPEIILRGTLWPGPMIGEKLGHIIRATAEAGHEVGLHAWDHHAWQAHLDHMDRNTIRQSLIKGLQALTQILGYKPQCSAAAGWKCNNQVLLEKNRFGFKYNSDCRGHSIFHPVVDRIQCTPQIPVTLPTYDEIIGQKGIIASNYNDFLLSLVKPDDLNVLTIHAEVEGMATAGMFNAFIHRATARRIEFNPLGKLLPDTYIIPAGAIDRTEIDGREGWVCSQSALG
jgi:undecaprenyl phosphate-alpha-L-ara4FN deformylase